MSAKFITAILTAGALIASLSAAPARADNAALKRFIGTAAGLYILGQALEAAPAQKVHERRAPPRRYEAPRRWQYEAPRSRRYVAPRHRQYDAPRHRRPVWQRAALPRHCLRQVGGRHGGRFAFSAYCLNRHYPAALPRACQSRAWYKGKARPVYGLGCLRDRGYRVARR